MELRCVVWLMNTVLRMPSDSVPISVQDKERIKIFDWIEILIIYSMLSRLFNMSFSAITNCSESEVDCTSLQIAVPREI